MIELPPPSAFGFPSAFSDWRDDQLTAVDLMLQAPTRFVALNMPTGSGKSLCYTAAAVLSSERTVILTSNKGLQDQLSMDFSTIGLRDVRGQQSYPCLAVQPGGTLEDFAGPSPQTVTCTEGPCHAGVTCELKSGGCLYYDAYRKALSAPLVVTNYAFWLAQWRYGEGMGKVGRLVLDEAHEAPEELAAALQVTIPRAALMKAGVKQPDDNWDVTTFKDWGVYWAHKLRKQIEGIGLPSLGPQVSHIRKLQRLASSLEQLALLTTDGNWLGNHTPLEVVFEVVNPNRYREHLFQNIGKVVLTSATLTPKTLSLLGVPGDQCTSWECPSRFPVERRPIWIIPTVQIDERTLTPEKQTIWVKRIDQIITPRRDRKGLVHTVSYKRRDAILARSEHGALMTTHTNAKGEAARVVAQFKKRQAPGVLISPSLMTGWDFPHETCRYQIVTKLPYPSPSPLLKARGEQDPRYIPYLVMQTLVQMVGRGMRSRDDWCETFLIDDHVRWFIPKYRDMAPSWFWQAIRTSLVIPSPLTL